MHRDPLAAAHARIAELEATVEDLRDKVNALEAAARGEPPPVRREIDEITLLEGRVERLRGAVPGRGISLVPFVILVATSLTALAAGGTAVLPYWAAAGAVGIWILLVERRGARRSAVRSLRRAQRRLAEARERATYAGAARVRVDAFDEELDDDVSQRDSARERR
jgi:hypothetical protein